MSVRSFAGRSAMRVPLLRTPHEARYPTTRMRGALVGGFGEVRIEAHAVQKTTAAMVPSFIRARSLNGLTVETTRRQPARDRLEQALVERDRPADSFLRAREHRAKSYHRSVRKQRLREMIVRRRRTAQSQPGAPGFSHQQFRTGPFEPEQH